MSAQSFHAQVSNAMLVAVNQENERSWNCDISKRIQHSVAKRGGRSGGRRGAADTAANSPLLPGFRSELPGMVR
jgi:hypothetical protein